jgi:hypothetical protein
VRSPEIRVTANRGRPMFGSDSYEGQGSVNDVWFNVGAWS